jgi:hypothetical protein
MRVKILNLGSTISLIFLNELSEFRKILRLQARMRAIPSSLPSAFSIKPTKSRSFLLGYATDLERRLIEQNYGKSIPTKNFFLRKLKITSPLKKTQSRRF